MEPSTSEKAAEEIRTIIEEVDLKSKSQDQIPKTPSPEDGSDFIRNFRTRPAELLAKLQTIVTGQEEACMILATKVCGHYQSIRRRKEKGEDPMNDIGRIKPNILLIGPTGVGKTFIIRTIARILGIPFLDVDATKFTTAGYVGGDVEDIIRDLVQKTKDAEGKPNIGLAQYGIVFIDEVDKITSTGRLHGPDVSGRGVQQALLTLIEAADVALVQKMDFREMIKLQAEANKGKELDDAPPKTINTKNILFIFSGAFPGIPEIVSRRINVKSVIGFKGAARPAADDKSRENQSLLMKQVKTDDLIDFGLEREFVGRIPVRVSLDDLTTDNLFEILRNSNSPIVNQFRETMDAYGTEISFREDALRYLAEKANLEKTGARGLTTVFEKAIGPYEFHLSVLAIPKITFSRETLDGTYKPLEFLQELDKCFRSKFDEIQREVENRQKLEKQVEGFTSYIQGKYSLELIFTDAAQQIINDLATKEAKTPREVCIKTFAEFESAFGFLNQRGIKTLTMTDEAILRPIEFLEKAFKQG